MLPRGSFSRVRGRSLLSEIVVGGRWEMPMLTGEAASAPSDMDAAIAAAYKHFTGDKDNDWLRSAKIIKKTIPRRLDTKKRPAVEYFDK